MLTPTIQDAISEASELIRSLESQLAESPEFVHLVTLVNRRTEEEARLTVYTHSDRFADVLTEIRVQRALRGLVGYEIHEALPCSLPF